MAAGWDANQRGFTLVELLVVVAIAAVLATIAVPSLRATMQINQLDTVSNQLVAALAIARSEAVRAPDIPVTVDHPIGVVGMNWNAGWVTRTPAATLQAQSAVPGQLAVWSNFAGPIGFDAMGRLVPPAGVAPPLIFAICADATQPLVNQSRAVIVSASGRASVARIGKAGATQGIPLSDTGAALGSCTAP